MEELLTPLSIAYSSTKGEPDALVETQATRSKAPRQGIHVTSPENALEALRLEPDFETLRSVLALLTRDDPDSEFIITKASPISARILNTLSSEIIPAYWTILNERNPGKKSFKNRVERNRLLQCLRNLTGLNAIILQLKVIIQQVKEGKKGEASSQIGQALKDYLSFLEALLSGEEFLRTLWDQSMTEAVAMQKPLWQETVAVIGGGKLLNVASEAFHFLNGLSEKLVSRYWVADNLLYSRWLGINISWWSKQVDTKSRQTWKGISILIGRALRLGSAESLIEELLKPALEEDKDREMFRILLEHLSSRDQKTVMESALHMLSKYFSDLAPSEYSPGWPQRDSVLVSAVAKFIDMTFGHEETGRSHLMSWLNNTSGARIGDGIGISRAVLPILSKNKFIIETVFDKSLKQFEDQLYIRHTPILQQEVHAQIMLLVAGYVHRTSPTKFSMAMRSGTYLTSISNHLAASSTRCKFLGMVVGEAMSSLSDKPEKQMKFKLEELESAEAIWYKSLVSVQDSIGEVELLKSGSLVTLSKKVEKQDPKNVPAKNTTKPLRSKIIAIEEVEDSPDDEDLVPYQKLDSDPEDSDEDATLVSRNKPTSPVYVRDLILYLRDIESYDKQKLALSTAPSLIRRKTNFGTEVSAHNEELAALLIGLQDKYDIPNFQDMRLQGMIATVVSQPTKMAPWFAKTFFDGDYSQAQRVSILTVLSVSARELGGFKEQDSALTTVTPTPANAFPSKTLPPKMHKLYTSDTKQKKLQASNAHSTIDTLATQLSKSMIQPMAAEAEKADGPQILKVRNFSTRLAVEAKRAAPTTNALSPIAGPAFFFPLTARFAAHLHAYGSRNVLFSSLLLSSFIKTLSLVLHACGPYTPQLAQMTSEFWDLLLSSNVRQQASNDKAVGQAVLIGFMTILEMNEERLRQLVEEQGREVSETQRWVDAYFQGLAGGSVEDDRVRSLAAAVLLRIRDLIEKYQALLIGNMSSF